MTSPLFSGEGPEYYAAAYAHNRPFATAGPYQTPLMPNEESMFRLWVRGNGVPFDVNAAVVDYDMRGYWQATGGQGWSPGSHFPDTYKTPYDTTFSAESRYATADCPFVWRGDVLVDVRDNSVVFSQQAAQSGYGTRSGYGPASGYGKLWHLEVQHVDGTRSQFPLVLRSSGSGGTVWDAPYGLAPGDQVQLIRHVPPYRA